MIKNDDFLQRHSKILFNSYQHWTGKELISGYTGSLADALLNAPFAVLSHDTQVDPLLNYSNKQGLALFGYDWDELLKIPSRLTAEPINREAREKLLAQVTAHGFISNYEGVRIAKSGQRFMIRNTTVWNLLDEAGAYYGQAAVIREHQLL